MKLKIIAVLLSLFFTSLSINASPSANPTIPIDLNKADVSALTGSFKGIGKKRAQAIIAYREAHHGFKSIEEFAEVKGLGQGFVDKHREALKKNYLIK